MCGKATPVILHGVGDNTSRWDNIPRVQGESGPPARPKCSGLSIMRSPFLTTLVCGPAIIKDEKSRLVCGPQSIKAGKTRVLGSEALKSGDTERERFVFACCLAAPLRSSGSRCSSTHWFTPHMNSPVLSSWEGSAVRKKMERGEGGATISVSHPKMRKYRCGLAGERVGGLVGLVKCSVVCEVKERKSTLAISSVCVNSLATRLFG